MFRSYLLQFNGTLPSLPQAHPNKVCALEKTGLVGFRVQGLGFRGWNRRVSDSAEYAPAFVGKWRFRRRAGDCDFQGCIIGLKGTLGLYNRIIGVLSATLGLSACSGAASSTVS